MRLSIVSSSSSLIVVVAILLIGIVQPSPVPLVVKIKRALEFLKRAQTIGEYAINTPTGIYPIKDINDKNFLDIFKFRPEIEKLRKEEVESIGVSATVASSISDIGHQESHDEASGDTIEASGSSSSDSVAVVALEGSGSGEDVVDSHEAETVLTSNDRSETSVKSSTAYGDDEVDGSGSDEVSIVLPPPSPPKKLDPPASGYASPPAPPPKGAANKFTGIASTIDIRPDDSLLTSSEADSEATKGSYEEAIGESNAASETEDPISKVPEPYDGQDGSDAEASEESREKINEAATYSTIAETDAPASETNQPTAVVLEGSNDIQTGSSVTPPVAESEALPAADAEAETNETAPVEKAEGQTSESSTALSGALEKPTNGQAQAGSNEEAPTAEIKSSSAVSPTTGTEAPEASSASSSIQEGSYEEATISTDAVPETSSSSFSSTLETTPNVETEAPKSEASESLSAASEGSNDIDAGLNSAAQVTENKASSTVLEGSSEASPAEEATQPKTTDSQVSVSSEASPLSTAPVTLRPALSPTSPESTYAVSAEGAYSDGKNEATASSDEFPQPQLPNNDGFPVPSSVTPEPFPSPNAAVQKEGSEKFPEPSVATLKKEAFPEPSVASLKKEAFPEPSVPQTVDSYSVPEENATNATSQPATDYAAQFSIDTNVKKIARRAAFVGWGRRVA